MSEANRARAYAKMYVELTNALVKEGVPEEKAREEARMTATTWLLTEQAQPVSAKGSSPCPLCGRK